MANQSTLPAVLARVRDVIAGSGLYPGEAQVRVSLEREPHPAAGPEFCHVARGAFRPRGWADGGGRFAEVLDGPLLIRCYARKVNDGFPGDLRALTDPDSATPPGLDVRAQSVINLLDVRFVEAGDGSGAHLTAEPLRLASLGEPVRYRLGREWIWAEVRFDCAIHLDLAISSGD